MRPQVKEDSELHLIDVHGTLTLRKAPTTHRQTTTITRSHHSTASSSGVCTHSSKPKPRYSSMMRVLRENLTTMTTQRDREPIELHLSPVTVFYTPSRPSLVTPTDGEVQMMTTVPVHRHAISSPDASYTGSVWKHIASSSLRKPCHRHIPLPSQIESSNPTVAHPLLQPSGGERMIELDFARSLSSVRVLGRDRSVNEAATSPPLPSLAIVHPKLPCPVVIQRSGDCEWVIVADVVEKLWHALHRRDPVGSASAPSFLESPEDATFTSRRMSSRVKRGIVHQPRLAYLRSKTRFMGLRAMEGDTWELLVVWDARVALVR
ncbi:hypothetical protein ARMGADRAFT_565902 [Armillaria gallica]|uniref:DUF6699 domain-containing protein n=1 Tax=Armillaria gallica TaxID=47427 RepID=A0A2H3CUQ5_ARMGA|nr:hypothetical protein ARMGADRAFT_565902 [Armillaria gallica]